MTERIDVSKLLREGLRTKSVRDQLEESYKLGTFRGGSIGMLSEDGSFVGTCPRLAFLRFLGYWDSNKGTRELMFQAGVANEDIWIATLKETFTGTIYTQGAVGITAYLPSGRTVTGSPDIVLGEAEEGKPTNGIELKQICSVWTARDVLQGNPKLGHLIQAGFYSMCMGIPYDLWYTCRSDFAITGGWASKLFPKQNEYLAKYCEYNAKGDIKKVIPFAIGINMEWRGGTLYIRQVDAEGTVLRDWNETIVTQWRIINYYNQLDSLLTSAFLPAKPETLDCWGDKEGYNTCEYCDLNLLCEKVGKNKEKFLAGIPTTFTKLTAKIPPKKDLVIPNSLTKCRLDPSTGKVTRI